MEVVEISKISFLKNDEGMIFDKTSFNSQQNTAIGLKDNKVFLFTLNSES